MEAKAAAGSEGFNSFNPHNTATATATGSGQTWVDLYMSYLERTSQVFANAAR